jgi:PAS domain S-box-containing protein
MVQNHKELTHIIQILRDNPRGMSLKQISEAIGMNRISVARYLDILRASGQVDMVPYGQAKLFYLSHRVSVSALLDFSSDLVVVIGRDQHIVQANKKFLSLVSQNIEEIAGKKLLDVLNPLTQELGIKSKIDQALEGKELLEEICIIKDEDELYFHMKIVPTAFIDGSPGITIILEDITEYKRTINALIESEKKYRTLIENLGDFLVNVDRYSVMHDHIRNPLQAIVGIADLEGGELNDKIHQQAEEIDKIITQLDIGRIEADKIREFLRKHYNVASNPIIAKHCLNQKT